MSDWTPELLLKHFEELREADQRALAAALAAVKEENAKTERASEKRFESVNEFRGQLSDQVNTFLPRKEYDARHEPLETRITELNDRMNRREGQTKGSDLTMNKIYAAIATVGVVLGTLVLLANNVL